MLKSSLEAHKLDFFLAETKLEDMFQMCTSMQLLKGIQSMTLELLKNESPLHHCNVGIGCSAPAV